MKWPKAPNVCPFRDSFMFFKSIGSRKWVFIKRNPSWKRIQCQKELNACPKYSTVNSVIEAIKVLALSFIVRGASIGSLWRTWWNCCGWYWHIPHSVNRDDLRVVVADGLLNWIMCLINCFCSWKKSSHNKLICGNIFWIPYKSYFWDWKCPVIL